MNDTLICGGNEQHDHSASRSMNENILLWPWLFLRHSAERPVLLTTEVLADFESLTNNRSLFSGVVCTKEMGCWPVSTGVLPLTATITSGSGKFSVPPAPLYILKMST